MCVGRYFLLECFDAKIVYAQKMSPPPTSLFDMGRWPSSIHLSFVRSFSLTVKELPPDKLKCYFANVADTVINTDKWKINDLSC